MFPAEARSGILGNATRAILSIVRGLGLGYPPCCVFNYSLDSLLGIPSGLSRGEVVTPTKGTYVPCHFHKSITKSMSRPKCLQLLRTGCLVEHLAPQSTIATLVDGRVIASTQVPEGVRGVFLQQLRLESVWHSDPEMMRGFIVGSQRHKTLLPMKGKTVR